MERRLKLKARRERIKKLWALRRKRFRASLKKINKKRKMQSSSFKI